MRVHAYARVSSTGQSEQGTSLEAQQEEFARYCRAKSWPKPIVYVEVESGGASAEERRVEQARLLASVRSGDVVLVSKQDRWTRHALYYLRTVEALQAAGAQLVSIMEAWDHTDPRGKTAAGMQALFAEQEHAIIKERTVGARRRLRALGHFVEGPPPVGYLVDRKERRLVPDPERVPLVRTMFELCAAGRSTREIGRELARRYPDARGLDAQAIARRLRTRVYLGELAVKGSRKRRGRNPGEHIVAHEPIIDALLWRRAQRALDERRQGGRRGEPDSGTAGFLLRGLVRCGHCGYVCGSQVVSSGGSTTHGGWYFCVRCQRPPRVPHGILDAAVAEAALVRLRALAAALESAAKEPQRAAPVDDREKRRAALTQKRLNVVRAIEDGTIPRDVARERIQALTVALDALDDAQPVPRATVAQKRAQARGWRDLAKAWKASTVAEKRDTIADLLGEILLWRSGERWSRGAWRWGIRWRPDA